MKTALVFAGGGAKGAYQAGSMMALDKLGYQFDIVTGTSVGALNGLLITQQDHQAMYNLWKNITIEDVFETPLNLEFSIESMLKQSNLIWPFFKSYLHEKGADITPLKNLIHKLYDGNKAMNSHIDFGLVTVKFPSLKPVEITKQHMTKENMVEYTIASASCFPAFPVHDIDNQGYIDGGYYDNLPISLAFRMGATKVIAICLGHGSMENYFLHRPNVIMIRPSRDLEGFLDFGREILDTRITLGYLDTMRSFHQLKGYTYTFQKTDINEMLQKQVYGMILKYEDDINHTIINKVTDDIDTPITDYLLQLTYKTELDLEDYTILSLETILEMEQYDYTKVYDFTKTSNEVYQHFLNEYEKKNTRDGIVSKYLDQLIDMASDEIVHYLYTDLLNDRTIDLPTIAGKFPKELICAIFFYSMQK